MIQVLFEEMDLIVSILGFIAGAFILTLSAYLLLVRVEAGRIHGLEIGLSIMFACAVYMVSRRRLVHRIPIQVLMNVCKRRAFNGLFLCTFCASLPLALWLTPYHRSIGYFIMMSFVSSLLALEIASTTDTHDHTNILLKIILLALSLRWTPLFVFPDLIGADTHTHRLLTLVIMKEGKIPAISQPFNPWLVYSSMPVFHLLIGTFSLLTGFDYRYSMMLSASLSCIPILLIGFLLGKMLFSSRVGLFATLFLAMADYQIKAGFYVIPSTFALLLVVLCVKILFTLRSNYHSLPLLLIVLAITPLTHTITSGILFIVIAALLACDKLPSRVYPNETAPPRYLFTLWAYFVGAVLTKWIFDPYISEQFGVSLVNILLGTGRIAMTAVEEYAKSMWLENFLSYLGFSVFYMLSTIGLLLMLFIKRRAHFFWVISAATVTIVPIIGVITGIPFFYEDRWMYASEFFMSVPAALSLSVLLAGVRGNRRRICLLLSFVFFLSFFLITNPTSNMDSPIYSSNILARFTFTESQVRAAKTIMTLQDQYVMSSDLASCTCLNEIYVMQHYQQARYEDIAKEAWFWRRDFVPLLEKGLVVVRASMLREPIVVWGGLPGSAWGLVKVNYDPRFTLNEIYNRVYDNGEITGFLEPKSQL